MARTLRSIERILAVQKQKVQLAEWKIFELQRRQAALMQNQDALKQLLDMEATQGSPLALVAMQTNRRAGLAAARLKQAEAVAKAQLQHEYRQCKLSERLFVHRRNEENHQQEKRLLDEIIDRIEITEI